MWQQNNPQSGQALEVSTRLESSDSPPQPPHDAASGGWLRAGLRALARVRRRVGAASANLWRRLRRKKIPDYVVIVVDHAVSERAPSVPWWYAYVPWVRLPLSLEYIEHALEQIAGDPDVRGVIFLFKGPSLSLARAQNLAQLFDRFRRWDIQYRPVGVEPAPRPKEIVVHLEDSGVSGLVVGAAADRLLMTPLGSWRFLGLRSAPLYLKETLDKIGVRMEVERVAPWKSAFETWERAHMSPESRDQTTWLLDSLFDDIVQTVAQGRGLAPESVQAQIDRAPLTAEEACAAGLIDAVLYEDELAEYLARPRPGIVGGVAGDVAGAVDSDAEKPQPVRLARYAEIRGLLLRRVKDRHAHSIGVISLEGSIVTGESRQFPIPLPLLGERLIGSRTATQQVRAARKNRGLAAVVLYVNSGGGSALASDLIWRELSLLAQEKPLIVYLGDVAASGGYYIATPGRKIVAQRATLTGSIGVIIAKVVTGDAAARLGANREVVQRGENADLEAEDTGWTAAQRERVRTGLLRTYDAFKDRVCQGRNLPPATVEPIAQGRVWTGQQAETHRLVDMTGDFATAVELACIEANLPRDGCVPVVNLGPPRTRLLAEPATVAASPGNESHAAMLDLLRAALGGEWESVLGGDRYWFLADGLPHLRD